MPPTTAGRKGSPFHVFAFGAVQLRHLHRLVVELREKNLQQAKGSSVYHLTDLCTLPL